MGGHSRNIQRIPGVWPGTELWGVQRAVGCGRGELHCCGCATPKAVSGGKVQAFK